VAEVFALILGVSSMRAAGNLPFSSLADAGLSKIEKALPSDKVRDLRRLLDCLYVGPLAPQVDTSNLGEMDPALLSAFETAFLNGLFLRFGYRDAKGAETLRQIEPQAMLILPPLWYLVAWDPSREDFRHFRMDRIHSPEYVEGPAFRRRIVPFDDGVRPIRIV
jgi:predicted DNA-binding transcriptional regulator YafY